MLGETLTANSSVQSNKCNRNNHEFLNFISTFNVIDYVV